MAVKAPGAEEMRAAFKDADEQRAFWDAHSGELMQRYPDQFVAVREGEVVAASPNLEQLLAMLKEKDLLPSDVWLRYMATDARRLLL
jgi:hypothetical protein